MKKTGSILILCLILVGVFAVLTYLEPDKDYVTGRKDKTKENDSEYQCTVIIDAGHGGIDPGKVGVNGVYEMDINLAIAYKVSDILEEKDIEVIMTRKDNNGLYKDSDANKKMADMNKRIEIINTSKASLVVSIHQNSFTSSDAKGAQVFYYKESDEGEELAENIQNKLLEMDKSNTRQKKSDMDYYILRKSDIPAVIVECGFLSNPDEARLLSSGDYQDKIAISISDGIIDYLKANE